MHDEPSSALKIDSTGQRFFFCLICRRDRSATQPIKRTAHCACHEAERPENASPWKEKG
jgi:hypothetical protein